ncbi:Arginase/agmatinase/formiminoglutamase [Anaeromyxobacter dehalogenans 2CP-1]|uniref:Arginase/agmatinase/formiminoglutamase n=1 Tax=Anaeromyxobacter dehalogenans (strain ATCC BAA-258 / DSM 21875 / 2CP-1) TaxID=455488 RepID=B8JH07_ANAD2|nr:agmatinase family protein [Anaeromyxobacter dehalogenans]ACL64709.1 Arginase/agmatinase/formiminoglutamase [Anaeromyxobacter dehalogenans 2CP-1]
MTFDPSAAAQPGSGVFGLPHSERDAGVVLVPVPFEATTSYGGGTSRGPEAILDASRQVDLFDVETGRPYEAGIHMLPVPEEIARLDREARAAAEPVIAAGGLVPGRQDLARAVAEVDEACGRVNAWVEERVAGLLARGKTVGLVGGDHSTALGAIAAHARRHPGMGLLHVDAHADLRVAFEGFTYSHASVIYNAAERLPELSRIVQVGLRDLSEEEHAYAAASGGRVVQHHDAPLARARFEGEPWAAQVRRIVEPLPREVYVSFDVDGLDPTLCPHTGTPVPGGLSFQEAAYLIGAVVRSGRRIVGFDLVEVSPGPDGGDWDGNVGARLLYKLIGWALAGR